MTRNCKVSDDMNKSKLIKVIIILFIIKNKQRKWFYQWWKLNLTNQPIKENNSVEKRKPTRR